MTEPVYLSADLLLLFDQDFHFLSQIMRTEFSGLFLFQRQQLSAAFRLLSVRQLSGQLVCNRTFSAEYLKICISKK